jgi:uncharacterized protein YdeI (YjbR/CyaY-like superfamily)
LVVTIPVKVRKNSYCSAGRLVKKTRWFIQAKRCLQAKRNIVLIHGFKEYCALLFIKGALLPDAHGILIQQTENVQAGRQIRFTNVREIVEMEPVLKTAFDALTPGRQRAYKFYFSEPKQSKTRESKERD